MHSNGDADRRQLHPRASSPMSGRGTAPKVLLLELSTENWCSVLVERSPDAAALLPLISAGSASFRDDLDAPGHPRAARQGLAVPIAYGSGPSGDHLRPSSVGDHCHGPCANCRGSIPARSFGREIPGASTSGLLEPVGSHLPGT